MNMCIHGKLATSVKNLRARVQHNMTRGAGEFCSEWKLTDPRNNECVWLGNISNMDGIGAFLNTEEEIQWDKDSGCVYKIYTMDKISGKLNWLTAIG